MRHVQALRDQLEAQVRTITPEAVVIAESAPRLPNTTSLALPGASAETLVIALDLAGIAVSAGAACSSGKVGASHVLAAMGLAPHVAARRHPHQPGPWRRRSATSRASWPPGAISLPAAASARSHRKRHGREQGQSTMPAVQQTIDQVRRIDVDQYKYGFETDIESVKAPKGLDESTVAFISKKKGEPAWMLEWRLEAFRRWKTMTEPVWANVRYPKIDFQDLYYYSAPKSTEGPKSLADVDPELLRTYEKLGIPLREREILAGVKGAGAQNGSRVAVDAVFDSRLRRHHLQG